MSENKKCTVIGCGAVGAAVAYSLTGTGIFEELVLLDIDEKRAAGEALDISHGLPFLAPMTVRAGKSPDMAGSAVVIVAAGAGQKPGETRLSLLSRNLRIFDGIIADITRYAPDALILVVSNPVDILTYYTLEKSGLPAARVIGSGTVLDTARLKEGIGKAMKVDSRNVHAFVIGEHGDSELPVFSSANLSGINLEDLHADRTELSRVFEEVRNSAYTIIEGKGATCYGIAQAVRRICAAVMRDEHSILTVSTLLDGHYGLSDVCLGIPTLVGRAGAERVLDIPLSEEENRKLHESAKILRHELEATRSALV